jgi:hypothetical protein
MECGAVVGPTGGWGGLEVTCQDMVLLTSGALNHFGMSCIRSHDSLKLNSGRCPVSCTSAWSGAYGLSSLSNHWVASWRDVEASRSNRHTSVIAAVGK